MTSVSENRMPQLRDCRIPGYRPNTNEQPVPEVFKDRLQQTVLPPSASWNASSLCFLQKTIAGCGLLRISLIWVRRVNPVAPVSPATPKSALYRCITLTKAATKGQVRLVSKVLWVHMTSAYYCYLSIFKILLYFEH